MLAAAALLGFLAPAAAQGAPELFPPTEPPAVEVATPKVWSRAAEAGGRHPLDAIAVSPADDQVWLVADHTGAVYRTADGGSSWVLALPGRASEADEVDDEAILLDAAAALEDEAPSADPVDHDPDDVSASADAARGIASDAAGQTEAVQREVSERAEARRAPTPAGGDPPSSVWFDPGVPGVALAGRPDGTWRSADGGVSWVEVDGELGASEFFRWGEVLVLGGGSGIRASVDGGLSFLDLESATRGATVYQLAVVGEHLYAATESGLYRSKDGLRWGWVATAGAEPIRTVVPDPTWPGGLWIAGERGLRRSDDEGASFYTSGTQPLRGMRRIVALAGPGHLFAISDDGVWESLDGGVRWSWAGKLLTEPDVRGVAVVQGGPVIATASGVWRLVAPTVLPDDQPAPRLHGLGRGELVAMALSREGLELDPLSLAGRAAAARFMPQLVVDFDFKHHRRRDSDYLLLRTSEYLDESWRLQAQLCWGGCVDPDIGGATATSYELDVNDLVEDATYRAEESSSADALEDSVFVLDGEVILDGQVVLAAANVAERGTRYRMTVAQTVGEAWEARQRVAAEAPLYADRALRDQIEQSLKLQELDARLDAYTGGAWTPSLRPPEVPR